MPACVPGCTSAVQQETSSTNVKTPFCRAFAEQSFAVEIQHEETLLSGQVAYIQAALLYTNSTGERRIR